MSQIPAIKRVILDPRSILAAEDEVELALAPEDVVDVEEVPTADETDAVVVALPVELATDIVVLTL